MGVETFQETKTADFEQIPNLHLGGYLTMKNRRYLRKDGLFVKLGPPHEF